MLRRFSGLLAVAMMASGAQAANVAFSTFDASDEGWAVGEFTQLSITSAVSYDAAQKVITTGDVFGYNAFVAPIAYLGDKSAVFGGTLRFDLSDTNNDGIAYPPFTLIGAGQTLFAKGTVVPSTDPNNLTSYSIALVGANFGTTDSGAGTVTDATLQAVLANLDRLAINADWQTGGDFVTLDNVYLCTAGAGGPTVNAVPEPATWALMVAGFGLMGSAARSRRRVVVA